MRERLKRIFILFMAAAVLLGAAPSTAFTALADEKETENEDLEIPKVFHKDDDNEVVRIVIGKTPSITIGKSSTISIAVKNTTDTDWLESEIWIAPEADYQGYYDEIEDEDGEGIQAIANGLRIAEYRLSSRDYLLKGQSIPGFTGELTLKCRLDGFHLTMANLLLHFAPYAGVDIKTALGMGGVTCE